MRGQLIWISLIWSLCVLLSNCKNKGVNPCKDGSPCDTVACEEGVRQLTVSQFGKVLGKLNIDENKHEVILQNSLHIDSIPMGELHFKLPFTGTNPFQGIEPFVFVFIQSINPRIDYYDYMIAAHTSYTNRSKYNYTEFKDSVFYGEAFVCFFDVDNNNSGSQIFLLTNMMDDTTGAIITKDTFMIDASKHTVVLDSVPFLSNLMVSDAPDVFLQYDFACEFTSHSNGVFVLTKYKNLIYDDHSKLYWENSTPYPSEQEIEYIFAFLPVLPSTYGNKFAVRELVK